MAWGNCSDWRPELHMPLHIHSAAHQDLFQSARFPCSPSRTTGVISVEPEGTWSLSSQALDQSQLTHSKCTPEPCIKIAPQPVAQWAWGSGRGLACASAGLGEHVRLIYVTCGPLWPLFVGKPAEPFPLAGVHLFSGLKYTSLSWAGAMPAAPGSLITIQIRSVSSS